MPPSPQEWAADLRQGTRLRQITDKTATIDIISAVYTNSITIASASERLAAMWAPSIQQWHLGRDTNDFPLDSLWTVIALSIRSLGHNVEALQRLADMLINLSEQPDVRDHANEVICWMTDRPELFWKDLPELTFWLRETAFDGISISDLRGGTPQEQTAVYTNANMFTAIYLNRTEKMSTKPLDENKGLRHFARWCLMDGLETTTDPNDALQIQRLECHLPAATNWLLVAGAQILNACRQNNLDAEDDLSFPMWLGGSEGGEWLWSESGGFSMRRWAFWKQRLAETAQIVKSETVREKNRQTLAKMAELERE